MPRVGTTPEEQTSGGSQFSFDEGAGEITACLVTNHGIPGYDSKCGFAVTIQRLNPMTLKPTDDEPITEFLAAGPLSKFHPGAAESSDDNNEDLEYGGEKDLGEEDDVEGTCILSQSGAGPDKKSKLSVFSNSLIEHGVKPSLLNGYGPNIVGLKATFTQLMMEKGNDYSGKKDPTCLIIGAGGKLAGGKVFQYPAAQGGGVGKAAAGAAAKVGAAPARPVAAAAAAKPASKANGKAPAAAPAATTSSSNADETAADTAMAMLQKVSAAAAGQTLTRQKIGSRLVTFLAQARATPAVQKAVQTLIKDDDWFLPAAVELEWAVGEAGEIEIPAAG